MPTYSNRRPKELSKIETCVCGHKQDVEVNDDLGFVICDKCQTMGEWGQPVSVCEPVVVEAEDPMLLPAKYVSMAPDEVFKPETLDKVLVALREKVKSFVPDVSSVKGRKEIASFAMKYSRTKTFLDGKGKDLVAKWKAESKVIDQERKRFRDTCDELRDQARAPLTEWEAEEEARIAAESLALEIEQAYDEAIEMNSLVDRERELARKEAELARIEKERRQKEESDRIAKEQAERDERIRQEAEAKAKADQDRAVREAEDRATAKAKREQEEKEAAAEATRKAEEKKAANKKHRAKIEDEIIAALIVGGTKDGDAIGIVGDIKEGRIPHLTINY